MSKSTLKKQEPKQDIQNPLELRDVIVRLGGSVLHTVERERVSAAEVIILRAAQRSGQAVVFKDEKIETVDFSPRKESRRLAAKYNIKYMNAAFPGWQNNASVIPTKFAEIDLEDEGFSAPDDNEHTIAGDSLPEPGTGSKD